MKLSKKLIVFVLFILSAFVLAGCKKDDKTVLKVGNPGLSGDFINGWGNSAYDAEVKDLIHGYATLVETEAGEFVWDTAAVLANAPTDATDTDGNKTYTFKLQNDLKWNTGEKITAEDYVLYILLYSSKDWDSISEDGALAGIDLVGYDLFYQGESTGVDEKGKPTYDPDYSVVEVPFEGVRLLGEYEFSLTIKAENLPYFYETVMVSANPIDLEAYLPGFEIKDDGEGAYIHDARTAKDIEECPTIIDVLSTTVNSRFGQRYFPNVTCGPYQLVSTTYGGAILELNPNFKTNYEGKKPTIDEVHLIKINQDTDVDQVIAGTVDLVTGVIEGEKIDAAKASKKVTAASYMRNGYGLLAMSSDFGPTSEVEVRRAIGYLFDRNVFLNEFLGGYGSLVNGPYGEAQWFYKETKDELASALTNYTLDVNKANAELDKSTYKFEVNGTTPFDPAKATATNNYFRYNAEGEALKINHLGTTDNKVTDLIGLQLEQNFWKAGIDFTTKQSEFADLLKNYYNGSNLPENERVYHLYNLATNYYSNYDPYYSWHSKWIGTTNNPGAVNDAEIDRITAAMRKLDSTQKDEFKEYFVEFVDRWNEILPQLPLYSNEYFDVINNKFKGLEATPVWRWSNDICDIKVAK